MAKSDKTMVFVIEWIAILLNAGLFVAKLLIGMAAGSIAIVADAWNGLFDSVSSLVVIVGTKFSMKPADTYHPFGYGRAEFITTLIVGIIIIFVGVTFLGDSIKRLLSGTPAEFEGFAILVVYAVSIISKGTLAGVSFWGARKASSSALKADALNSAGDVVAAIVILAGVFLGAYFWWIDGVLGILVALLILYSAFGAIRDAVRALLGVPPSADLLEETTRIVHEHAGEESRPHHFHLHQYGGHEELTFHIRLPRECTLERAHAIATKIERAMHDSLGIETTIHIEPRIDDISCADVEARKNR